MNSTTCDFYPQKILNSSPYNEPMPNSISSFPQNLDYFQGMLPYMNYQLMDNYNDQFPIYNPFFNKKILLKILIKPNHLLKVPLMMIVKIKKKTKQLQKKKIKKKIII